MGPKRYLKCLITLVIISIYIWNSSGQAIAEEKREFPTAIQGHLDATDWDFNQNRLLSLQGEWELHWEQLLDPIALDGISEDIKTYVYIPTELHKQTVNGRPLSADGYATLRLKITVRNADDTYGLKIKTFGSASKIWINGKEVAAIGQVATNQADYTPKYAPLEVMFEPRQQTIDLVIQIANFHHSRVKLNDIYLGKAEDIHNMTYMGMIKDSFHFGSLLIIGLYHLIVYIFSRKEPAFLLFSLISIVTALRGSVVNERMLVRLFADIPAEVLMKIGFIPVFILLPLLIMYVKEVFESESLQKLAQISKYALFIFIVFVIITPLKVYDVVFQYFQIIIVLYGGFVILRVATKEIRHDKSGAYIMAFGGLLVFFAALNDTLRELDYIEAPEMLSFSVLIFILFQAFFLAWRYNKSFVRANQLAIENEIMYKEIQELNVDLERRITARTLQLEIANSKLQELSKMDSLTGLPNRRFFDEKMQREWMRSILEQHPISVLMIDIDYFKEYNDTYGHLTGDDCLHRVANILARSLSETDFIARYGGEEFVVILPDTEREEARFISERLKYQVELLAIPHQGSKVAPCATVSIGISTTSPVKEDSLKDFLDRADQALYKAKACGRNQVCIYSE